MEKGNIIICPSCKCNEAWYIQSMGSEEVYQCMECNRYFKVKVNERVKQEVSVLSVD